MATYSLRPSHAYCPQPTACPTDPTVGSAIHAHSPAGPTHLAQNVTSQADSAYQLAIILTRKV